MWLTRAVKHSKQWTQAKILHIFHPLSCQRSKYFRNTPSCISYICYILTLRRHVLFDVFFFFFFALRSLYSWICSVRQCRLCTPGGCTSKIKQARSLTTIVHHVVLLRSVANLPLIGICSAQSRPLPLPQPKCHRITLGEIKVDIVELQVYLKTNTANDRNENLQFKKSIYNFHHLKWLNQFWTHHLCANFPGERGINNDEHHFMSTYAKWC